ncbi:MAG: SGNH/GDSL hydrolase family protein [Clostridium butyricum]|nr:SGNH/GDSL hydrolase family protein [Clostridium butyricum]
MSVDLTEEIIEKSLINKGDISRILKLFEKVADGKDITIAFLGGSITQGCNASIHENCYVELVTEWFKQKFNDVKVNYINAGVGATGSLIGVHRVERQVLSKNPDLVFVDAAVNDDDSYTCKVSYESEIRKLLSSPGKPAVIEVFMTMENGVNYQEQQIEIGKHYNLPMISFRESACEIVKSQNLKWSDLLTDEVHPNDDGHNIIATLLINFLENIYSNDYKCGQDIEITDDTLEKDCVFGDRYINGKILNNRDIEPSEITGFKNYAEGFQVFQDGWKFEGKENEDGKLTLEVEGKNIILLYKKIITENAGKFTVKVNGKEKVKLDTYFKDGWGDWTVTEILEESDEIKKHKLEIEVENENKKREVTILGVLVS